MKSKIEHVEVYWADAKMIRYRDMRMWLGAKEVDDKEQYYLTIQDKGVKIDIPLERILPKIREEIYGGDR